jgi:hypothetical protein
MIDSVEPLSCVLWAVAFFAAGMYPLGFMLGAPCSPCCDPQCGDEPIEFNRCIRFVNTDTSAPPTTYAARETVSQPLHGFSRAVSRPEQVGAMRVGTKADFTASLTLAASARAMSDGETQSATYRYYYRSGFPTFADVGTAKQWNVTLVGVTRPLTMPTTVEGAALQYQIGPGASNPSPAREYGVGVLADSTSAPVSVTVHSVAVLSGSQFLDGNTVTDATLKAMLTATIPLRSGTSWVARLAFAATSDPFQYVPANTSIALEYVIKHSRGSQHRFRTFAMSVFKRNGSTVTPIPEAGLAPINLPQPPYADTPYVVTPATYSDTDPDAVSIYSSDVAGVKSLKTVELVPAGEQLRSDILLAATNSSHVSSSGFTRTNTEFGYIMRPFDPGGGYGFNSFNHPAGSPWNYNVAEVEAFLAGGYTLPYNSGTSLLTHSNTWTMEATEPTQLCGVSFCHIPGVDFLSGVLQHTLAPHTIKYTAAPLPPPRSFCSEPPVLNLRAQSPSNFYNIRQSCTYAASFTACDSTDYSVVTPQADKTLPPFSFSTVANLRWFFCGDALWASENGGCRDTVTITGSLFDVFFNTESRPGTYSLDGDDEASATGLECVEGHHSQGTCPPLEVTVNVPEGQIADQRCNIVGSFAGGDVVLPRADRSFFSLDLKNRGCAQELYHSLGMVGLTISLFAVRERNKGCDPWGDWRAGYYRGISGGVGLGSFNSIYDSCNNGFTVAKPITFVEAGESPPAFSDTADPPEQTVPAEGGTATVQFCCPEVTQNHVIAPSDSRYPKYFSFQNGGATARVTQAGKGDTHCPFTIAWLSGITIYSFEAGLQMFASERCPIKGQVNHAEWPPCEWSVTSSAAWLIAEKIPEEPELEEGEEDPEPAGDQVGLLKLSINPDDTTVFSGTFRGFGRAFRSATITITSGATVNTWTIIQLQP